MTVGISDMVTAELTDELSPANKKIYSDYIGVLRTISRQYETMLSIKSLDLVLDQSH